jgi:hypothetical protein
MIPHLPYGARVFLHGFDDPHIRHDMVLQQALHQRAPRILDGGREVLWQCPLCRQPWHALGRGAARMRLPPTQVARLARRLEVDLRADAPLPSRLCPACAGRLLGGQPAIETYLHDLGYRLTWTRAAGTPRLQFVCCLYRCSAQVCPDLVGEALSAPVDLPSGHDERLWPVLDWLSTLPDPVSDAIFPLTPEQCARIAASLPLASGMAWHGYAWRERQTSLGPALLVMAVTFPAPCSCPFLLAGWRQIARAMQVATGLEANWR